MVKLSKFDVIFDNFISDSCQILTSEMSKSTVPTVILMVKLSKNDVIFDNFISDMSNFDVEIVKHTK